MTKKQWTAVDQYITDLVVRPDAALDAALDSLAAAGLPAISVSSSQGKLLHILARMHGAHRILEIGTLGGYSTIWLARALPPGGRVVTLEIDPTHAKVAHANFERARVTAMVDLRVGPALDTLPKLATEGGPPFDFFFIDADKVNIPAYFDWALKLARAGSVIIVAR